MDNRDNPKPLRTSHLDPHGPKCPLTYRDSGVDVDAGNRVVDLIRAYAAATARPESVGGIGGFGGLVGLPPAARGRAAAAPASAPAAAPAAAPTPGTLGWREPVLVSGADGVGTKLKIAFMLDKHDTVGIDCVAYNVNDIICSGAEPLFFLDYIGIGKLVPEKVAEIVKGVAAGCIVAGAALAGGETAELPGLYAEGEYDLAGFAVGVVERHRIIDGSRVRAGDVLVGLASTGLQSSGFSLVRRATLEVAGHRLEERVEEFGRTLGEELLTPTAIYPRLLLHLFDRFDVRAVVNITGGGFYDNIPRALPEGLGVRVSRGSWPEPPVFDFIRRAGDVEDFEMFRTFNMGVGMAIIVPADQADSVCRAVAEHRESPEGAEPVAATAIADGLSTSSNAAARAALAPLVALAQPPGQAWPIGVVVPQEKFGLAAPAGPQDAGAGRRVVICGKGGRRP